MKYRVEHFKPEEFLCPCCKRGGVSWLLVLWLDLLRRAWGGPVRVNSGFRCVAHNREVGGAARSRHLLGCAADVAPVTPEAGGGFSAFAALAQRLCALPGWEVIVHDRYVHIAVPREDAGADWDGSSFYWD